MKKLLLCSFFTFFAFSAFALDGKALYNQKMCQTCHGPTGKSVNPMYPSIAGQDKDCLKKSMKQVVATGKIAGKTYCNGKKPGKVRMGMSMKAIVKKLSDKEAGAIAEYLAKQKK